MTRAIGMVLVCMVVAGCGDDTSTPADMGMQGGDAGQMCPALGTPTVAVAFQTGQDCGEVSDAELLSMLTETALECGVREMTQDADCAVTFETECDATGEGTQLGDVWEWAGTLEQDGDTWSGNVRLRRLTGGVLCTAEYRLTAQ